MSQHFSFAGKVAQSAPKSQWQWTESSVDSLSQYPFSVGSTHYYSKPPAFYLAFSTLCVFSFTVPGESTVTPRLLSCLSVALMTLSLSTPLVSVAEATSAVSSVSLYVGPLSISNPDFKGKWSCSSEVFKRWFTWPYRKREHVEKTSWHPGTVKYQNLTYSYTTWNTTWWINSLFWQRRQIQIQFRCNHLNSQQRSQTLEHLTLQAFYKSLFWI